VFTVETTGFDTMLGQENILTIPFKTKNMNF